MSDIRKEPDGLGVIEVPADRPGCSDTTFGRANRPTHGGEVSHVAGQISAAKSLHFWITICEGGHLKMSTARTGLAPDLSAAYVREIFKNLESGDGKEFFDHVAENVDWIVEGTHPLAGHYHSKAEFLAHTFEKLAKVLPKGAELHVEHALVSGDWAVVELHSEAIAKNGFRFDNRYCWICRFANGTIVEVRAYLDSVLVARLFEENPI